MNITLKSFQFLMDGGAIGLSIICAVHCLLLPIAIVFFPSVMSIFIIDERFHLIMVLVVIPISFGAFFLGCGKHRHYGIVLVGLFGIAILVLTALFGHQLVGEKGERLLTLLGSGILAWGHFKNYRQCHYKRCCS